MKQFLRILKFIKIMNLLSIRYGYGTFREMVSKYRVKSRQKRANFVSYWNRQRQRISDIRRSQMPKPVYLWCIFLSLGFLYYFKKHGKQFEKNKILNKLDRFYSTNIERQTLRENLVSILVTPKSVDELTHLIVMSKRYHHKVIVQTNELTVKEKIAICEKLNNKCLFINLSNLKKLQINDINGTIDIQSGNRCGEVNQFLLNKGYQPIFHKEFEMERVYDIIANNLPLLKGQLANSVINLEMISANGQNFRSAGQTNKYGRIPSLNSLFLGMGGQVALPSSVTIKIDKAENKVEEKLKINIKEVNQKINSLRKLSSMNRQLIEVELTNVGSNQTPIDEVLIFCRTKIPLFKQSHQYCASFVSSKNIPISDKEINTASTQYNVFFSVNDHIFQQFLLKYDKKLGYFYSNGLLKVKVEEEASEQKLILLINEITNNNGALIWCRNREVFERIKPSLYSSEIGAQLMRKIVQVRKALDPSGIFYSQNRYEDYFKKGIFRRLTEIFW